MALNNDRTPKVILSSSGMCDAGRIRHHLKYNLWRPECTVLFVGYQAVGTLGRKLNDGEKTVKIFGDEIAVHARDHRAARRERPRGQGRAALAQRHGAKARARVRQPRRRRCVHGVFPPACARNTATKPTHPTAAAREPSAPGVYTVVAPPRPIRHDGRAAGPGRRQAPRERGLRAAQACARRAHGARAPLRRLPEQGAQRLCRGARAAHRPLARTASLRERTIHIDI